MIVLALYYLTLTLLVAYAAHRLLLSLLLIGRKPAVGRRAWQGELPRVTVQLPLYNEQFVAERLLRAVAALDYPRELLEVQVLDDSTDATAEIVERIAAELRAAGTEMRVLRRASRAGYKAGALAQGTEVATGAFIAIFDADFVPPPSFLREVLSGFEDDRVGMVQARWEHMNLGESWLTQLQGVLLDGHFAVEQAARSATGRFFNFNGTAGMWRREAIAEAGGWQGDTLTEDLDLSYRAQLKGWQFRYLDGVTVPAEVPSDLGGFVSQQQRWAKGSVETLLKLWRPIVRARLPFVVWREAAVHLTSNLCYLLTVLLALLMPPAVWLRRTGGWEWLWMADVALLAVGGGSLLAFYGTAARRAGRPLAGLLWQLPLAMALDVGMSVQKSRAVLEALAGRRSAFVRTPKFSGAAAVAAKAYALPRRRAGGGELALSLWLFAGAGTAMLEGHGAWAALPFLLFFGLGFGLVGAAAQQRERGLRRLDWARV
jgi:cellulose synthase/poly-beta-1,6-N-acetylglucosamine synthase-like glycosyltransferase